MMLRRVLVLICYAAALCMGQLTLTPSSISVTEGSDITLQCGEVNEQFDVKIFFKDDMPKPIDQSRLSSVVEGGMRVFTYTAVEAEENGAMIVCSVLDDTNPTAPVPLTVWFSKLALQGSSPFSVEENSDLTIYVTLDSNPMENVTMTLDPMPSGHTIDATTSNVSVTFSAVERSDAGSYTLTATNDFTSGNVSFEINVLYAPEFTVKGGSLTSEVGQTVTLDCSASGSPEPVVTPLNNELPPNVAFVNDKYVITDGNTSNDGVYICQAENSVSVETLSFNVQFSEPPAIGSLNAGFRDERNLVLSWEFTEDKLPISEFLVSYETPVESANTTVLRPADMSATNASTSFYIASDIYKTGPFTVAVVGRYIYGDTNTFSFQFTFSELTEPTSDDTATPTTLGSTTGSTDGCSGFCLVSVLLNAFLLLSLASLLME